MSRFSAGRGRRGQADSDGRSREKPGQQVERGPDLWPVQTHPHPSLPCLLDGQCVCVCCVCVYARESMRARTRQCTHWQVSVCTCMFVCACMCACVRVCVCARMCVCCTCMHTRVRVCVYVCVCLPACISVSQSVCLSVHVHAHARVSVCVCSLSCVLTTASQIMQQDAYYEVIFKLNRESRDISLLCPS